ncbi:MAG: hypothetical protein MUF00_20155 [Gemmatimonadaceae bacterium]|nr:hypothetical protein [Gemmatimonadaceae bacterium]
MSDGRAIVFVDDAIAAGFAPFAATRPLCSMRAGALSGMGRWQLALRPTTPLARHFVAADALVDFPARWHGVTAAPAIVPAGTIVVNARALPLLPAAASAASPTVAMWQIGDAIAAVRLGMDVSREQLRDGLDALVQHGAVGTGAIARLEGVWLTAVWDLVATLPTLLPGDITALALTLGLTELAPGGGHHRTGEHPVWVHPTAIVEPSCLLDTSAGPILLEQDARVQAFTRLVGPAYIGPHSSVTTDRVAVVSLGPYCKVHGEMSNTLLAGYSNKGHDGFVGHSVLGEWVNLGAGTITSNLKNTYGTVSLWTPDGVRDTGQQFLGTLFGDHAKTGIGLRLTTGCVIGAGANCFDAMPPKMVPPFAWGSGAPYGAHALEKFLETASRMMARRGQSLDADGVRHWTRVHAANARAHG